MENVVRIDSAKIDDIWKNHIKNLVNPEDRIIIGRGYCIEGELPKDGILFLVRIHHILKKPRTELT